MTKQTQKPVDTHQQLRLIRQNRRAFRNRGATSQTLQCVETFFELKAKKPRVRIADVARALGVDRKIVSRHMARAEAMQLVVRSGRTFYLFAKMVLQTVQEAVTQRVEDAKRKATNRLNYLIRRIKSGKRDNRPDHIKRIHKIDAKAIEQAISPEMSGGMTRQQARKELKAMYIPPHLRKNR